MNHRLLILMLLCPWLCCGSLLANPEHLHIINRGNGAEPDSLDIHQAQGLNSHNILMDMYEGLMTFDPHGKPQYGVATAHYLTT